MVALTSPAAAATPAVTAAKTPFIVSPGFDAVFFFASVLAVFAAYIASAKFGVNGFYVLAVVAVVSNGPHLTSTWTRVYFDKREWRTRPFHIFVVPVLVATFVASMTLWTTHGGNPVGDRALNSILLYWATWHFLAQNWGILRIYQRKSGEPQSALAMRLERPLMCVAVGWCMLHRLQTGPRNLFGTDVYFVSLPWPVIDAVGAVAAVLAATYLALRVKALAQPWGRAGFIRAGFLLCCFLGFFVPFILITADGMTAFAAAACWHGFQYLGIVRHYHRNAWKDGSHPDARVMSWLSQPSWTRRGLYFAFLLSLAGAAYVVIFAASFFTLGGKWNIETWGGVVWLSLTFSHYYLDGVIWKLRRDTVMASRLGV